MNSLFMVYETVVQTTALMVSVFVYTLIIHWQSSLPCDWNSYLFPPRSRGAGIHSGFRMFSWKVGPTSFR